ncbi:hypothetical protein QBC39DRAFT_335642 [Podospora conica]|nr:hypothetical protein QBC39DRAFT_335642 [Schizothecium conicum]
MDNNGSPTQDNTVLTVSVRHVHAQEDVAVTHLLRVIGDGDRACHQQRGAEYYSSQACQFRDALTTLAAHQLRMAGHGSQPTGIRHENRVFDRPLAPPPPDQPGGKAPVARPPDPATTGSGPLQHQLPRRPMCPTYRLERRDIAGGSARRRRGHELDPLNLLELCHYKLQPHVTHRRTSQLWQVREVCLYRVAVSLVRVTEQSEEAIDQSAEDIKRAHRVEGSSGINVLAGLADPELSVQALEDLDAQPLRHRRHIRSARAGGKPCQQGLDGSVDINVADFSVDALAFSVL